MNFSFIVSDFCVARNFCLHWGHKDIFLFSSISFIILSFMCRSLIHTEINFCVWYEEEGKVFCSYGYPGVPDGITIKPVISVFESCLFQFDAYI